MKLDLNFNENTHLREWWKQVYNNFKNIQDDFTEAKARLDNACTKDEAKSYIMNFINSSQGIISALETLKAALEENSDIAAEFSELTNSIDLINAKINDIEEFSGKQIDNLDGADLNSIDDGIRYYFKENLNVPSEQDGLIIQFNGIALAVPHGGDGLVYKRIKQDEVWSPWIQSSSDKKQDEVVIGKYEGTDTATLAGFTTAVTPNERFINLGFTPRIVEISRNDGLTVSAWSYDNFYFGGTAMKDLPCISPAGKCIEITENGFKVYNCKTDSGNMHLNKLNAKDTVYYYKAYR